VDLGILDQVLPPGGGGGEAVALGGLDERGLGATGERVQHRGQRQVDETVGIAPGMGMGGAHEAVADHADVQRSSGRKPVSSHWFNCSLEVWARNCWYSIATLYQ